MKLHFLLGLPIAMGVACASQPTPSASPPEPAQETSDFDVNDPRRGSIGEVEANDPGYQQGERLERDARSYGQSIEMLFGQHQDALNQCYLTQLKRDPSLRGSLTMEFTVIAGGTIKEGTESLSGTLNNKAVHACVLKLMHSLTYPEPYNGEYATVRRSLQFGAF